MTVKELVNKTSIHPLCVPDGEREIEGVYVGDLLSWVMGRAHDNQAWITIMSNVNVVAVATLSDVPCVILAEGVTLDDEVLKTAVQKGVNVLTSSLPIDDTAVLRLDVVK